MIQHGIKNSLESDGFFRFSTATDMPNFSAPTLFFGGVAMCFKSGKTKSGTSTSPIKKNKIKES